MNMRTKRKRKFKSDKDMLHYFLKRWYKAEHGMPKPIKSLMEEERFCWDEDGDGVKEYGYIQGAENATDDEIQECVNEERIRICSPYDCTGKLFTWYIDWHRNPNGMVSYVHYKLRDV